MITNSHNHLKAIYKKKKKGKPGKKEGGEYMTTEKMLIKIIK